MPEHDAPWTAGWWRVHVGPVTGMLHIVTGSVGHIVCTIPVAATKRYEDARLIAAAPALYQALQKLRDEAVKIYPRYGRGMEDAVALANGVLALARGETND